MTEKKDQMTRLDPSKTGLALAITISALYIGCSLLYALWPGFGMGLQMATFHGSSTPMMVDVGLGRVLSGLIVVALSGYLGGALFAQIHNRLAAVAIR